MGFWLLLRNTRELWKERELRLLILLSLFLQWSLATHGSQRKFNSKNRIQFVVWTVYLLAESIATVSLGVLSNRLVNIKEMKGAFDSKSQITAFWASFLLLHLGGPDAITAFALADNELWLRQLARLCVGLACYIYYMALSGSTLSLIAKGMILVGFIKYAERTLCLYLASKDQFRDSMRSLPNFGPVYPRKMEQYLLKREEGYQVGFDEVIEFSAPEGLSGSDQGYDHGKTELFKIFKLLFVGMILNSGDLAASRRIFMDQDMLSENAFGIVEIELGFMYDLLYTKARVLNCAWGIIRWVISLSVPCAVLIIFSLQYKDYPKVDACITLLLVSVTILLEIYSLLLAISSDWVDRWRLQKPERSTISSIITSLRFFPKQRWSNYVAQFSLLRFSIRKGNGILPKYPWLTRPDMKVEKNFYVDQKEFKKNIKEWIFSHIRDLKPIRSKSMLEIIKVGASDILTRANYNELNWSVEVEFDQSILIWHIATELCYYQDRVFHPPMLPTAIGVFQYEDTLVDAQKFLEDKQDVLKLFKKESHAYSGDCSCKNAHKSRKSLDLCKVCRLLHKVRTQLPAWKMRGDKSTSVLFDACYLASQLSDVPRKWEMIGNVWASMLMSAAYQSKGNEHCESLSRGGELLSHVWLLMAHLGMALPEQSSGAKRITKLTMN
ncbi:LOW QUALITY PROTEIN: hypothetical protein BT93_H1937 [Corymbia citriodora subsp. variegata]|nr:LOW QUALITY PROTEIN: hypothetical protein BT93_H1937 [Corymbia citriodora subsp. variegata]